MSEPPHVFGAESRWNPSVNASASGGRGTFVTMCGRKVYEVDFEQKQSVVANPANTMVGCSTCGKVCPTHAISLPDLTRQSSGSLRVVVTSN